MFSFLTSSTCLFLSFSREYLLSQFRAGLNISVNLCITALPLSLKWMGSQFAHQIGNLSGGGGSCYLPHVHQVLFSPKVYLLYWGLAPVKDGGSKGFCFLSWHLVPSGLGCNALDSGWRNMVPGMEWNETHRVLGINWFSGCYMSNYAELLWGSHIWLKALWKAIKSTLKSTSETWNASSVVVCRVFFVFFFKNLLFIYLFIYWLRWVFVAARGPLSSCGERGPLLAVARASHCDGLSFCRHGLCSEARGPQ